MRLLWESRQHYHRCYGSNCDSGTGLVAVFQVSEIAHQLGVNPQTLYFYERIGLIPSPQRSATGYRLYNQQDLERLVFIIQAKSMGFSLDDIKELLNLQVGQTLSCQAVYDRLQVKIQHIEAKIKDLQALKTQLDSLLIQCKQGIEANSIGQNCQIFRPDSRENNAV